MSRPVLLLLVALAILLGGLFLLAGNATERPLVPVEKSVSLGNLA